MIVYQPLSSVCIISTKTASDGSNLTLVSTFVYSIPAGSRPGKEYTIIHCNTLRHNIYNGNMLQSIPQKIDKNKNKTKQKKTNKQTQQNQNTNKTNKNQKQNKQ